MNPNPQTTTNNNNDDKDEFFTKLIYNKFLPKVKLGEGSFGKIYIAENTQTHELVAIKLEPKRIGQSLLETESYILCYLKGGTPLTSI
jgi:serine/threonine protein kinase